MRGYLFLKFFYCFLLTIIFIIKRLNFFKKRIDSSTIIQLFLIKADKILQNFLKFFDFFLLFSYLILEFFSYIHYFEFSNSILSKSFLVYSNFLLKRFDLLWLFFHLTFQSWYNWYWYLFLFCGKGVNICYSWWFRIFIPHDLFLEILEELYIYL
jgi:hypothetical protein